MTFHQYEIIISKKHELIPVSGITIHELSRLCECQLTVVRRLCAIGLIEPLPSAGGRLFDQSAVVRVRKALRLKRDLGLNFDAVALVMELLDRIDELERKS